MTPEELDAFLRRPFIAFIATVKSDGSPHITPVWFHYDGVLVYVAASSSSVKVRNIKADPHVSLCIFTDTDRSRWVQVNGSASLSNEDIPDMVRTMSKNYLDEDDWERYSEQVLGEIEFTLITVNPGKILGIIED